jgi:hypothetical protein
LHQVGDLFELNVKLRCQKLTANCSWYYMFPVFLLIREMACFAVTNKNVVTLTVPIARTCLPPPQFQRLNQMTDFHEIDIHESVHRDMIMKVTNKMQFYRLIYYFKSTLHVLGDVFAHHQEHLTVFTASGSIHPSRCRLVSWMS